MDISARNVARVAGRAMGRFLKGLAGYLSDWRNLLGHAAVGAAFLAAALWVPVSPWVKAVAVAALIAFNVARGRRARAKRATAGVTPEESA